MGDAEGIHMVGYCYWDGIRVEKNEHKAFIYYQKSAEMGDSIGTYNVGYCYRNGIGVGKDERKAFIHYQKSAEMRELKEHIVLDNVIIKELELIRMRINYYFIIKNLKKWEISLQ